MKVEAKTGFSGKVSMAAGEIREIPEGDALSDLLKAGYVTEVAPVQPEKKVAKREGKRSNG